VQTQHGVAVAGIVGTDVEHSVTRLDVDGGQENPGAASLTGSLYNGITVFSKLLAV
jgi:hypothetical protein